MADSAHTAGTLDRFLLAQDQGDPVPFARALQELQAGRKQTHWIWYVLPQLRGLGESHQAHRYGVEGLDEARDYLQHPVLRLRYRQVLDALLVQLRHGHRLDDVLGHLDAMKTVSSITLFRQAERDDLLPCMDDFFTLLEAENGHPCRWTLEALRQAPGGPG